MEKVHVVRLVPQEKANSSKNRLVPPAPTSVLQTRQKSYSAPSSPIRSANSKLHARAIFHSSHSVSRTNRRKLQFVSPRLEIPDQEIFPSPTKWQRPNDRWKSLAEQAGQHKQDGTVFKVTKRIRTPAALSSGMPPSAASRVEELHLPMGRRQEGALPAWLDVVSAKFKNVKHLYLVDVDEEEEQQQRQNVMNQATRRVVEDEEDSCESTSSSDSRSEYSQSDSASSSASSKSNRSRCSNGSRVRRLYVLYRLPHLLSINGKNVSVSERLLARPNPLQNPRQIPATVRLDDNSSQQIQRIAPSESSNSRTKIIVNEIVNEKQDNYSVKAATAKATSLLDFAENENDDNTSQTDHSGIEVCLSGQSEEKKEDQYQVENKSRGYHSPNGQPLHSLETAAAAAAEAAFADLDRLEYASTADSSTGSVVACDWTCGGLSIPYFRRCRPRLIRSNHKSPSSNGTPDNELPSSPDNYAHVAVSGRSRSHLTLRESQTRNHYDNNQNGVRGKEKYASMDNLQEKIQRRTQLEPLILAPPEPDISLRPRIEMPLQCSSSMEPLPFPESHSHTNDIMEAVEGAATDKLRNSSISGPDIFLKTPPRKVDRRGDGSPYGREAIYLDASPGGLSRFKGDNERQNGQVVDSESSPESNRNSPASASSPNQRIPPSQSLASPFPMQFRVRATAIAKTSKRISPTSPSALSGTLSVSTNFDDDYEGAPHQPSPPPPPPAPRGSSSPCNKNSLEVTEVSPRAINRYTMETIEESFPLTRTQSSPSNLSGLQSVNRKPDLAPISTKPPPCPEGARRRALVASASLLTSRNGRKRSGVGKKWREKMNARTTSIMDQSDEEDDDSVNGNLGSFDDDIENTGSKLTAEDCKLTAED